jgi:immune inhibitor A
MTHRTKALAALFLFPLVSLLAQDTKPSTPKTDTPKATEKAPDLTGFKTVADAVKADTKTFKAVAAAKPVVAGFIGIEIAEKGKPVIEAIAPESPAEKAGVKVGDTLSKIADDEVTTPSLAKDRLRAVVADEKVKLTVLRDNKPTVIELTPRPTSKPFNSANAATAPVARAIIGITSGDPLKDGGVEVSEVSTGGAAEKAGIKAKDIVLKVDDKAIDNNNGLRDLLANKKVGDVITVLYKRDGKELTAKATLQAEPAQAGRNPLGGGWDDKIPRAWAKDKYNLVVLGIDYSDVKHSDKISDKDWESSLFSDNEYKDKSATGQKVFGSMADYYKEISYGKFKVTGKFGGWVEASKKRMDYSSGNGTSSREKTALLVEVMDKYLEKNGKESLKDYDGVFFLFAGERVQTTRGSLYWPHRASFRHNNKSWPYFIVQEGGPKMTDISVFCHEFGHMLGLPDLYARPEVPGMEGVGVWCAMSQQLPNGRPQHFSAWSKEQLGWLKPTMIDPRVKQKLILSPIEDDNTQCFKIPLKADGSEFLLLENRKKKGFDTELPAEGLIIWRVLPGNQTQKVFLEESHGVEGPTGPRVFSGAVPFPSPANDSFTPYTIPSSKAQTGGGFEVFITNVKRLPDGRVTFHIGYDYQ